ncbi:GerAB/ArcD/ProY family transporter [Alkalihalobacillus deserti]|uniref:GerAB/ArcD/ProY family transporter n=1 Tax=Alkalihalobacillus deserti TaxID=2879466 RepID=UPI001D13325D|nr:GerAB/ArcD/ProY family transporter [Alkalihalobacillus deserti]
MIRISNIQLFVLIIVFEVGSTTLFALGIGAKQDAWIVVLLAAFIGFFLVSVYTQIAKLYPNKNFSEILNEVLGKKVAAPLLLLFALYFYSQASHNFFEFGVLIKMTALEKTPLFVILYLFIIVIMYILSLGFEVLARTCEILLPYFLVFLILIYILTLFSGQFDFSALRPVLGNGLKPILEELPSVIAFPFGEMVVFLMFWHYIDNIKSIRKTAFLAVGLSALLIMTSIVVMVSVLGPEIAANAEIPLLQTILTINIAEIITNLDSIAIFFMFIGGFYKTALHFWGFVLAITWLFRFKSTKWIMIIFGLLLPLFAYYRFPGFDYQRWIGTQMGIFNILVISILPVLLLAIMFIKKRKKSLS